MIERRIRSFPFKNSESRDNELIKKAFADHGMTVADISRECLGMWTWVLLDNGELWVLDKSHGGGGVFTFERK